MVKRRSAFPVVILICLALLTGAFAATAFDSRKGNNLGTALEVISLLKATYVDPVSTPKLLKAYLQKRTVRGMLDTLQDPYTRYMDPKVFKDLQAETRGSFGGIGIIVGMKNDRLTIVSPIENTPGYRAGLKPGDLIDEIDGRSTEHMSTEQAVDLMRGEKGTHVRLTLERTVNGKPRKVSAAIIRDDIKIETVQGEIMKGNPEIGYIRISSFSENTGDDLATELAALRAAKVKALIVDLRYNPGGLLYEAVEVCSQFLPKGKPVVHVVGRMHPKATYRVQTGDGYWGTLPVAILTNEGSASASEIVTGALQDYGIATVVGTRSFGKGLVQSVIPMSNGAGISITTDKYLTAKGRSINKIGITPDIVVKLPDISPNKKEAIKDTQLETAIEILKDGIKEGRVKPAA